MTNEAPAGNAVHFWSGGACRTAHIKDTAPIEPGIHLLEVQLPGEPSIDVWCEQDEARSENSWHLAQH